MTEALSLLLNLSVLIFVLTSMFGMGLSLTLKLAAAAVMLVGSTLVAGEFGKRAKAEALAGESA